jgi:hypothetical protein
VCVTAVTDNKLHTRKLVTRTAHYSSYLYC